MFRRILIPLDGSALAERALPTAAALARAAGGELTLLRVAVLETMFVPAAAPGGVGLLWPDQAITYDRQRAEDYLKRVSASPTLDGLSTRRVVAEGDVASTIVDTAAELGVDLIAMSSHGYSGVTRWILGSVAEKVLRSAPCPVLVLRSADPIRSLLVPLDGSELSERVLGPALDLAGALGSRVRLLRVVPDVPKEELEELERIEPGMGRRFQREVAGEAIGYLERLAQAHRRPALDIQTAVAYGRASEAILTHAEEQDVDLIAMATHGRTGLRRWVYGSVTEKVLHGSGRSTLVVRVPAHELNSG